MKQNLKNGPITCNCRMQNNVDLAQILNTYFFRFNGIYCIYYFVVEELMYYGSFYWGWGFSLIHILLQQVNNELRSHD